MAEIKTLLKVTQEKLPASQLGLEIEIPADLTQKTYEQVVNNFVKNADIPGFRRGKVPRQVVLQRMGQVRLKAAALEELVQKSLDQAINQEKIPALGNYQLKSDFDALITQFAPGSPLTFSASVDIPPEVTLGTYTGLQARATQVDYDPTKLEQVLNEQQKQRATLIPIEDRPAKEGDTVLVDFTGQLANPPEGTPAEIPGGTATDFQVDLNPGQFIPGFIEGIMGMSPGEQKEVEATFPADYFEAALAGQPALFSITLKEIKEKELPALDDEFAAEISEFETMAALQEYLEKRYTDEAAEQTKTNIEAALLAELVKSVEVDLPETLVKEEVNFLMTNSISRLQSQGIDVNRLLTEDLVNSMRNSMRPEAELRLKRSLALGEVAKREKIQVDPAEIETRIQESLKMLTGQKIDRQRLRDVVENELLETKTLDWLRENSQVTMRSVAEAEAEAKAEEEAKAEAALAAVKEAAAAVTAPAEAPTEGSVVDVAAEPVVETVAEPVEQEAPAEVAPVKRKTTSKKAAPVAESAEEPAAEPAAKSEKTTAKKTTTKKAATKKTDPE